MYQSFTLGSGFFSTCLQSVCVHDVRYISKYCVLSVFYSCKYTLTPLLYLSFFVCAHSYHFSYLHTTSTTSHPILRPSTRLTTPSPFLMSWCRGLHTSKFFIFFQNSNSYFRYLAHKAIMNQ